MGVANAGPDQGAIAHDDADGGARIDCKTIAGEELSNLVGELVEARRRLNVTQVDLSGTLGITPVSVSGWEARHDLPTPINLFLWARALGYAVAIADRSRRRYAARPAPRADESPEQYWIRCVVLILRDIRQEANLTQAEVGRHLSVSTWTVHMWENMRRVPRISKLAEWCCVLDCRLILTTK